MIKHTQDATLIAIGDNGFYSRNWDLYRCNITGLFFKFGLTSGVFRDPEKYPLHRVYLRKSEVRSFLNEVDDVSTAESRIEDEKRTISERIKVDHTYRMLEMAAQGDGYIRYRDDLTVSGNASYKIGAELVSCDDSTDWNEARYILSDDDLIEKCSQYSAIYTDVYRLTTKGYRAVGIEPPAGASSIQQAGSGSKEDGSENDLSNG